MSEHGPDLSAERVRGHYGYRYHVPLTHNIGDPPPPLLLTVDGMTEEVADYMGRHYLCEMATLGTRLETCPGRLGRLARWIVRRARFEGELIDGSLLGRPSEPDAGSVDQDAGPGDRVGRVVRGEIGGEEWTLPRRRIDGEADA